MFRVQGRVSQKCSSCFMQVNLVPVLSLRFPDTHLRPIQCQFHRRRGRMYLGWGWAYVRLRVWAWLLPSPHKAGHQHVLSPLRPQLLSRCPGPTEDPASPAASQLIPWSVPLALLSPPPPPPTPVRPPAPCQRPESPGHFCTARAPHAPCVWAPDALLSPGSSTMTGKRPALGSHLLPRP